MVGVPLICTYGVMGMTLLVNAATISLSAVSTTRSPLPPCSPSRFGVVVSPTTPVKDVGEASPKNDMAWPESKSMASSPFGH